MTDEITALRAENERLRAENAELRKVDFYWDYEDPETAYPDYYSALDEAPLGEVVRLMTGKSLPDAWATTRVLTVDKNGDADETEGVLFDNEADAEKCWDQSLAAAKRAADE